ncbi:energy transducer TonB [Sphingosinicella sp. LY1275]|uniref:energy transducer TonB n=1 Tax=Sphingosinicella sp. LY1275 TaxID=3095379 RepID=UPI002ADEC8F1|nr:energy transducer TonB [Sphingosinicella sp. LY1275]MEA1013276.1 energy transducer TonB [Sphingosinicella sp. LY1275]
MSATLSILLGLAAFAGPDSDPPTREIRLIRDYYPAASLKAGEQGTVGFEVALNRDGKIESCRVTSSSGFPRLDEATCDMIVRTARFRPSERSGSARIPRQNYFIEWTLPAGHANSAKPQVETVGYLARLEEDELVCRRALKTGSIIIKQKVCLTRKQWERTVDYGREEAIRLTSGSGPSS